MLLIGFSPKVLSQELKINEAMSSNVQTILDEDGDSPDWIELYNPGASPVNLMGYGLSDSLNADLFWDFPDYTLGAGGYLVVFASDKNRIDPPLNWTTVIDLGETWKYMVPDTEPQSNWNDIGFDDSAWLEGKTSIGYGDGDDSTLVDAGTISVFMRKTFEVADPTIVEEIILHFDYDDAFVAYINGVEVARAGITSTGPPPFDQFSDTDREAIMRGGGAPEEFVISDLDGLLVTGSNVLSVQGHNAGSNSSDMTFIPILSLGKTDQNPGSVSPYLNISFKSFHTNFKISSEGETIYLRNPSGEIIDTLFTTILNPDLSIGRNPDGANNLVYFDEPTPGTANDTPSFPSFSGNVLFSNEGGIYSESISVTITPEIDGDPIYYTIDGSIPDESDFLYNSPLQFGGNIVLQARAIRPDAIPGKIKSGTYLFNVNHELPIVSITVDPYDMFDNQEGMYTLGPNADPDTPNFGANFWEDRELPVYIEMFETDGSLAFSTGAGIKIFGGWSRANAQKSLTIHARKSYGGPIKYKVFPDKDLDEFSSLVLRNSGNDWNNTMLRDGVLGQLFNEEVDRQAFRPAVIYINGDYWGIQNIREKINEHFVADNHGLKSENVNIVEANTYPVFGDETHYQNLIDFVTTNNLAVTENYEYVKTQMDVLNFIFYETGNIYVNNTDWPGNNIKFWRESGENGIWRWIIFDTDFGFGIWDYQDVSNNTLDFALDANGPSWPNPPWSTRLLRNLMDNVEFKHLFINAFADQLNTTFLANNVHGILEKAKSEIQTEIEDHLNRWGGSMDYWNSKVNEMYQFALGRPQLMRGFIIDEFNLTTDYELILETSPLGFGKIKLNTITPESYPWSGRYFTGIPVTATAEPNPGYEFVRWEGDVSSTNPMVNYSSFEKSILRAVFAPITTVEESIVINEINYSSSPDHDTDDWVELYNRGSISIDLTDWVLKDDDDNHAFVFPNISIQPNEYLVVTKDSELFSSFHPGVNHVGDMDFGLSSNGDCVRLFNDTDDLLDVVCYEEESPWPEEANGQGSTLALGNPSLDNANPLSWYALNDNGNPGEDNINSAIVGIDGQMAVKNNLIIYPNPASNIINIKIELENSDNVTLLVHDSQGKEVKRIFRGNLPAGYSDFSLNIDQKTAPGLYYIRMLGNNHQKSVKILIDKQ